MSYTLEITENNTTYQVVVDSMAGVSNGPSAYEVAVSNGFIGTESEWLASLVGADGIDGSLYDDTTIQAEVDLNTAKVGITTQQASDITANNAKVSNVDHPLVEAAVPSGAVFTDTIYNDTTIQAEVDLNTAKVGITTQQASDITANKSRVISFAVSDETTDIATGTENLTIRMPHGMTLTEVRASVTTAPVGSTIIIDVNQNGSSIFTTDLLSIDASEKTSTSAATSANITTSALTDDAEITIDIDQVGSTTAGSGLKIYLIGTKS